jgi:hypothetical protein
VGGGGESQGQEYLFASFILLLYLGEASKSWKSQEVARKLPGSQVARKLPGSPVSIVTGLIVKVMSKGLFGKQW